MLMVLADLVWLCLGSQGSRISRSSSGCCGGHQNEEKDAPEKREQVWGRALGLFLKGGLLQLWLRCD